MRFKFWQSLYADDIFISYSRRDGEAYLTGIEAALSNLGSSCFSDKLGTDAGRELPETLKERIRFCKTLVLLGTPAAVSEPKLDEYRAHPFYGALLRDFRWHCGQPPAVRAAFVRAMGIEP